MKTRITVTIDNSVLEKLPKYGKSGVINEVLKRHFQRDGFDQLYESLKKKLINDAEWAEYLELTIRETR